MVKHNDYSIVRVMEFVECMILRHESIGFSKKRFVAITSMSTKRRFQKLIPILLLAPRWWMIYNRAMLYEYACVDCDHHFDVRHGANEKPDLACPLCQSKVKKVFHASGIIFKGSGWYVTDSAPKRASVEPIAEKTDETVKNEPAKTDTVEKTEAVASSETPKTDTNPAPVNSK